MIDGKVLEEVFIYILNEDFDGLTEGVNLKLHQNVGGIESDIVIYGDNGAPMYVIFLTSYYGVNTCLKVWRNFAELFDIWNRNPDIQFYSVITSREWPKVHIHLMSKFFDNQLLLYSYDNGLELIEEISGLVSDSKNKSSDVKSILAKHKKMKSEGYLELLEAAKSLIDSKSNSYVREDLKRFDNPLRENPKTAEDWLKRVINQLLLVTIQLDGSVDYVFLKQILDSPHSFNAQNSKFDTTQIALMQRTGLVYSDIVYRFTDIYANTISQYGKAVIYETVNSISKRLNTNLVADMNFVKSIVSNSDLVNELIDDTEHLLIRNPRTIDIALYVIEYYLGNNIVSKNKMCSTIIGCSKPKIKKIISGESLNNQNTLIEGIHEYLKPYLNDIRVNHFKKEDIPEIMQHCFNRNFSFYLQNSSSIQPHIDIFMSRVCDALDIKSMKGYPIYPDGVKLENIPKEIDVKANVIIELTNGIEILLFNAYAEDSTHKHKERFALGLYLDMVFENRNCKIVHLCGGPEFYGKKCSFLLSSKWDEVIYGAEILKFDIMRLQEQTALEEHD